MLAEFTPEQLDVLELRCNGLAFPFRRLLIDKNEGKFPMVDISAAQHLTRNSIALFDHVFSDPLVAREIFVGRMSKLFD